MTADFSRMASHERRAKSRELRARVDAALAGQPLYLPELEELRATLKAAEEAFENDTATPAQLALLARRDAMNQRTRRTGHRHLRGGSK